MHPSVHLSPTMHCASNTNIMGSISKLILYTLTSLWKDVSDRCNSVAGYLPLAKVGPLKYVCALQNIKAREISQLGSLKEI